MQAVDKRLGQHLCAVRKRKHLTQFELSEKCECSEKYLGDIERGKRIPSFGLLCRISIALETLIESFLVDVPIDSYSYQQIDASLAKKIMFLKPPYLEALEGIVDKLIELQEKSMYGKVAVFHNGDQ